MDTIKAEECGIRTITFAGAPGNIVQWSVPRGYRILIQSQPANANNVFISSQNPNTAGAGTPSWVLQPLGAGPQYTDRIDFPSGYPGPLWFSGTAGEAITIFIMPCGKGDY